MSFQMPSHGAFTVCTEGNETNYCLLKELSIGGYTLESGQKKYFLKTSLSVRAFASQGPLPRAISKGASHY